jgi:hypothetical protein
MDDAGTRPMTSKKGWMSLTTGELLLLRARLNDVLTPGAEDAGSPPLQPARDVAAAKAAATERMVLRLTTAPWVGAAPACAVTGSYH